jgi:hypothetical protein
LVNAHIHPCPCANFYLHMIDWLASHGTPYVYGAARLTELRDYITQSPTPPYPTTLHPIINVDLVENRFNVIRTTHWHNRPDPRLAPSSGGYISCMYAHYMLLKPTHTTPFCSLNMSPAMMYTVIRFRLGIHDLPVAKDRRRRIAIPRGDRVCTKCDSGLVGDELHMIFECAFLDRLRYDYSHLFHPDMTMSQFFHQQEQHDVVRFVHFAHTLLTT